MAQESIMELMQKPEIKQAMQSMMFGHFEQQKKSTLKRYKMLNQYTKKGQILFVGSSLMEANEAVEELSKNHGFNFINVNEGLADEEGNLKSEFSMEGLHLWPNAYSVILENMKKYL